MTNALPVPVIKVLPLSDLLFHEEVDGVRSRELAEKIKAEGVLRDPIIVTRLGGGYLVLDGAHRCSALRALGCRYVVAQLVDYDDPRVKVLTWSHVFLGEVEELKRRIEGVEPLPPSGGGGDSAPWVAVLTFEGGGGVVLRVSGGLRERALALNRFVGSYLDLSYYRASEETICLLKCLGEVKALVRFSRFEKSEITALALKGLRLPAGVTRHIVPGRVLGLKVDISLLEDGEPEEREVALRREVRERFRRGSLRIYLEPVISFDN